MHLDARRDHALRTRRDVEMVVSLCKSQDEGRMYRIRLINFGWDLDHADRCETFEQAVELARRAGFESAIYEGDRLVGHYSALHGTRRFHLSDAEES